MLRQLLKSLTRPRAQPTRPERAAPSAFAARLAELVAAKQACLESENFDHDRWVGMEAHAPLREKAFCKGTLADLLTNGARYEAAYESLEDGESREWFLHLVAFRILGHRHVRLPSNRPEHWTIRAQVKSQFPGKVVGIAGELARYEGDFEGEHLVLDAWWSNIAWTFFFRQYYLSRGALAVAPRPGDVAIDAGACFGDTALGFAARVGARGRVLALEIDPINAAIARRNIAANPGLASHIELHECALSDSAAPLYLHGTGPGARVSSKPSAHRLAATTVDELAAAARRVDFIKMDIEGAEGAALRGAEQTLRGFRPRLAISVYHGVEDLWRIPVWLDSLGLGYRFYLEHYTIHYEETVLYALADPPTAASEGA